MGRPGERITDMAGIKYKLGDTVRLPSQLPWRDWMWIQPLEQAICLDTPLRVKWANAGDVDKLLSLAAIKTVPVNEEETLP